MFTFTIDPVPPFDLDLTAAIFACGDPQIRAYREGCFRQALIVNGVPIVIEVRSTGTSRQPKLKVSGHPGRPFRKTMQSSLKNSVETLFGTNDDPARFYAAIERDEIMSGLVRRLEGLRCPETPTVFEALVDSVIEQQISLAAARKVENRLIRATGKTVGFNGETWYCYPAPEILAEVTDDCFRTCGLTRRKGEYIRGISRSILDGDLDPEGFRTNPDTESIISELMKIRGIGRWTAELAILRGLHRPDAFPADDIAVRRFISRFYLAGKKVSSAEARVFSEKWGNYRGFAAFYLEVADLLGIMPDDILGAKKTRGRIGNGPGIS
jgi:DNA-3-methyladenine glycosylase II